MTGEDPSKSTPLNSSLSILYTSPLSSIRKAGIPVLLTSLLSILIWVGVPGEVLKGTTTPSTCTFYKCTISVDIESLVSGVPTWFFSEKASIWWIFWTVPLIGFAGLDFAKVEEKVDKVIKYVRVSSESQKDQYGKERQFTPLEEEIKKLDVEDTYTISDDWESARTMLRENIQEILDMVADNELTYCLMLEDVDRLSRAEPFEASVFLWIAKEHDVIVYFDSMGYFDLTDPGQQLAVFFELYQSRKEFEKIKTRASSGQRSVKERGGVPNKVPYGYEKEDDTNILRIHDEEANIIRDAVAILLDSNIPISSLHDDLEKKYGNEITPSYATLLNILRKELYTGKIRHDGEVVGECPQIITENKFEGLQQILADKNRKQNEEELDHILKSILEQFEIDTSLQLFDVIKGKCPDCGGDVETWGSTKRWGERVLKYRCEDDQCEFEGPLLSEKTLQRWGNKLPVLCPICQTPAGDDDWKKSKTKIGAIEQNCDECGLEFTIDISDDLTDGLKRGLEFPEYAIQWFRDECDEDEETDESGQKSVESSDVDDNNDGQHKLGNFG